MKRPYRSKCAQGDEGGFEPPAAASVRIYSSNQQLRGELSNNSILTSFMAVRKVDSWQQKSHSGVSAANLQARPLVNSVSLAMHRSKFRTSTAIHPCNDRNSVQGCQIGGSEHLRAMRAWIAHADRRDLFP